MVDLKSNSGVYFSYGVSVMHALRWCTSSSLRPLFWPAYDVVVRPTPVRPTSQRLSTHTSTSDPLHVNRRGVRETLYKSPLKIDNIPLGVWERVLYRVCLNTRSPRPLSSTLFRPHCRPLLSRSPVDVGRAQVGRTATL